MRARPAASHLADVRTWDRCPSCGSTSLRSLGRIPPSSVFAGRDVGDHLPSARLVACKSCRLGFRDVQLTLEKMDALYAEGDDGTWADVQSTRADWAVARQWINERGDIGSVLD